MSPSSRLLRIGSMYQKSLQHKITRALLIRRLSSSSSSSYHQNGSYAPTAAMVLGSTAAAFASAALYIQQQQQQQQQAKPGEYSSLTRRLIIPKEATLLTTAAGATTPTILQCEALAAATGEELTDQDPPTGYTEAERFYQNLAYHRELLFDYQRRWGDVKESIKQVTVTTNDHNHDPSMAWPTKIPKANEIAALEADLQYCHSNLAFGGHVRQCQDLEFRIASYYISQKEDAEAQKKGFRMLRELATHGHPDGMCLYGIVLNDGLVAGIDPNPQQAISWWRRCVDLHRHVKAMYELAVTLYTGEGIRENTEYAVKLFRRAANMGHAGAAYMLGECLLDGVGVERDRGEALEWLVTAAELGHYMAKCRVFTLLNSKYEVFDCAVAERERKQQEADKWLKTSEEEKARVVTLERRYSIGGVGSRNPHILARRKSIVAESRVDNALSLPVKTAESSAEDGEKSCT